MPPISDKPSESPFDFDVAVVGYGPVGMTFAILMALRNFNVCVFERYKERWKEPRHGHVDGQIMRIMQDIGIARDVEKHLVIDVEHHDPDREIDNLECNAHVLSPGRQYLAGRWEGGRWSRWEFARNEDEPIEELQKRNIRRHSLYTFEARVTDQWREDRVLLMGDAAHTTPPHLGQGMCSGVRDSANLAWKLSAVLEDIAGPEILDTYQPERASHVEAITKMAIGIGSALQKAQQLMSEPSKAEEFLRAPQPPEFPKITGGRLLGGGTFQSIGRPMLQGRVLHQGRIALLGDFLPHGWTIITRQRLPRNIWTSQHNDALVRYGVTIARVSRGTNAQYIDLDGDYDVWCRTHKKKAILVRPEHYVFDAADLSTSATSLVDQLAAAMGSFPVKGVEQTREARDSGSLQASF